MPTASIATLVTMPTPTLISVVVNRYAEICVSVARAIITAFLLSRN